MSAATYVSMCSLSLWYVPILEMAFLSLPSTFFPCTDGVCETEGAVEHQTSSHRLPSSCPDTSLHCYSMTTNTVTTKLKSDTAIQTLSPEHLTLLTGSLNPGGLKSDEELNKFWSPSLNLHLLQPYPSTLPSPTSVSARSSVLQTPSTLPARRRSSTNSLPRIFTFKNYSPTASVDDESHLGRPIMSQSAIHTPSILDETAMSDPLGLSQSVFAGTSGSHNIGSLAKASRRPRQKGSFKTKLGSLFGMFGKREEMECESEGLVTTDTEDYVEVFVNSCAPRVPAEEVRTGSLLCVTEGEMVGKSNQHDLGEMVRVGSHADSSGIKDSEEELTSVHSDVCVEGQRALGQLMDLDISTLPLSRRSSRSSNDSSQNSYHRDATDSPNTAGAGRFNMLQAYPYHFNPLTSPGVLEASSRMSSSYPRTSYLQPTARLHTSNSDTIFNVKERLQELVEEHYSSPSSCRSHDEDRGDKATPLVKQKMRRQSAQVPLSPPPAGRPLHMSPLYPAGGGWMTMRRLSVCSRKSLRGSAKVNSESSDGGATVILGSHDQVHDPNARPLPTYPSPVALLDQFVTCGEVLHRGGLDTIPLTEQEGIDWNHFGGCPHSEEFRIMQSQVTLLHSQMLFERHQCLQHARRNRRLLSKARSTTSVAQELVLVSPHRPLLPLSLPFLLLFCT